jgi:phytoene synthase
MYTTKLSEWELIPSSFDMKYELVDGQLEESYNFCLNWMSEHSKSFFFASRFLPDDQRRSVAALYAFCRLTDDIVDEVPTGTSKTELNQSLDELKSIIDKLAHGFTSSNPILQAFGDTVKRHNIPMHYMHELIEGIRMDLNVTEYTTDEELDLYMFRVASTVGLMMTHIFMDNPAPETLERAADLGKAMQLTNILRDIKEDFERGRIYLPEETRKIYSVDEADLRGEITTEKLQKMIEFEIIRAKNFYARADLGIKDLPPTAAYTIKVASQVYGEILNEIKRMDYQVLRKRAVVSKLRKIILATKVRLEFLRKI